MKYNPELDMRRLGRDSYTHKKLKNYKRWKKQRVRQGFSTRDLWNMDNWLCNVIPDALDKLMEIKCGYPAYWDDKGGKESYEEYVKQIAADIRKANSLTDLVSDDNRNYTERMDEANRLIQSAFARLASIIWGLWD